MDCTPLLFCLHVKLNVGVADLSSFVREKMLTSKRAKIIFVNFYSSCNSSGSLSTPPVAHKRKREVTLEQECRGRPSPAGARGVPAFSLFLAGRRRRHELST